MSLNLQNIPAQAPQLAPPGAGLPWWQKLFLKYYIGPFVASRATWDESERVFRKTSEKIIQEISNLNFQQMNVRVLVPSQSGLEDSSRYWSIAMVLEHLVIVGTGMSDVIPLLCAGMTPPGEADIAKVKPQGQLSVEKSVRDFHRFITEDYRLLLAKINLPNVNKDSKLTFFHPWFGPMPARQWFWLLGVHNGIHLKQIREIKKILLQAAIK